MAHANYYTPTTSQFRRILAEHPQWKRWAIDTETTGLQVRGHGAPDRCVYVGLLPVADPQPAQVAILCMEQFNELRQDHIPQLSLVGHNLRFDLHALDFQPRLLWEDTCVAKYFEHTNGRKSLDFLAACRGWPKVKTPDAIKEGKIYDLPFEVVAEYLADDVITTMRLAKELLPQGHKYMPDVQLEYVILDMERRGVHLDLHQLQGVGIQAETERQRCAQVLMEKGFTGNPASPKQTLAWLQGEGRKIRSTNAKKVLEPLADKGDELASALVAWRKANKLINAFIETLPKHRRENGRVYPDIRTTKGDRPGGTDTCRLAYADPNLQQIPKRTKLGRLLRSCFGDPRGVSGADFKQLELRMAAVLSGDPDLLEVFSSGRDPFTEMAARLHSVRPENVSDAERFRAKTVSYGILNGMGGRRLSIELRCPTSEAKSVLRKYQESYPRLAEWMSETWGKCAFEQRAQTIAGRTRVFGAFEDTRPGISTVVQGSAAELVRQALIDVHNNDMKLLLQIHDEILVVGKNKHEELSEIMEQSVAQSLRRFGYSDTIPFPAEGGTGASWGDC